MLIAFFLGGAVANFAYDFPAYAFYSAQQSGQLTTPGITSFWYSVLPALYYLGFASLGYVLAKTGFMRPIHVIYFYIFLLIIAYFLGLQLQHAQDAFWLTIATAGLVTSGAVTIGVLRKLQR